jgi:hypothetical protein
VERHRHQRQWLLDLEQLLDPEHNPPKTSASVRQAVAHYLAELPIGHVHDAEDQTVVQHIQQTFHSFAWGLFTCYDQPEVPRTNNQLERFIRQMRMGRRRISGQKNVHDFVMRYGPYATLIDPAEPLDELLARLDNVDQDEFWQERKRLQLTLLDEAKIHRFRHHRQEFLADLETRWQAAVSLTTPAPP